MCVRVCVCACVRMCVHACVCVLALCVYVCICMCACVRAIIFLVGARNHLSLVVSHPGDKAISYMYVYLYTCRYINTACHANMSHILGILNISAYIRSLFSDSLYEWEACRGAAFYLVLLTMLIVICHCVSLPSVAGR